MAQSRTIRVTQNLTTSLADLKKAVKTMPAGEAKKQAERALAYMSKAFAGGRQPGRGLVCPRGGLYIG
jgi:hypothetical protein